jgi:hypothetical protein
VQESSEPLQALLGNRRERIASLSHREAIQWLGGSARANERRKGSDCCYAARIHYVCNGWKADI